jgi:hypothetical protein
MKQQQQPVVCLRYKGQIFGILDLTEWTSSAYLERQYELSRRADHRLARWNRLVNTTAFWRRR